MSNHYLYNGKELQNELDLNWYDYGARMYMPELGRFMVNDRYAEKYSYLTPYQYGENNPILMIDINGDSTYLMFDGKAGKLYVYNDQNTSDDYGDDKLVGTYKAHNKVASRSNGKWEDGIYEMEDKNSAKKHPGETEPGTDIPQDSKNGRYGENGIYRAKNFTETTTNKERIAMGVHSGRENQEFAERNTMGCIRTTEEAMNAIQSSIDNNGALRTIIIRNNRDSNNSQKASDIQPGIRLQNIPKQYTSQQDNTRIVLPAALYYNAYR